MADQGRTSVPRSRGHGARRRSQLAADRALERAHARLIGSDIEQEGQAFAIPARRCGRTTKWIAAGASSGSACISATSCRSTMPAICRATAPTTRTGRSIAASPICPPNRATRPRTGAGASAPTTTITGSCSITSSASAARADCATAAYEYGQINVNSAGVDDLLTRGNGAVNLPPNFNSLLRVSNVRARATGATRSKRKCSAAGSRAMTRSATASSVEPTLFHQRCIQRVRRPVRRSERRTGWSGSRDNLIGSFDGREAHFDAGFNWIIGSRQELRLKLQAIGVNARPAAGVSRRSGGQRDPHR